MKQADIKAAQNIKSLHVSVREIAAFSKTEGGLAAPLYGGITGQEGIRLHNLYRRKLESQSKNDNLYFEFPLKGFFQQPGDKKNRTADILEIEGRADLITVSDTQEISVTEIKSFRGSREFLPPGGDSVHLMQLKLYAYLLLSNYTDNVLKASLKNTANIKDKTEYKNTVPIFPKSPPCEICLKLHYISLNSHEIIRIEQNYKVSEIIKSCEGVIADFLKFFYEASESAHHRDLINAKAAFPFAEMREGQRQMMRAVAEAAVDKKVLFINAPTGIGKTIATIYPLIKTQAKVDTGTVFYLAPTKTQLDVCQNTVDFMRRHGFKIHTLYMTAKEKICPCPEIYCDKRICPYAVNYYHNLRNASGIMLQTENLDRQQITKLAETFKLCPFELELEALTMVDLVMCDYNYFFDPKAYLQFFAEKEAHNYCILVDEAHNLAARSREMYSAVLRKSLLSTLTTLLQQAAKEIFSAQMLVAAGGAGADKNQLSSPEALPDREFSLLLGMINALESDLENLAHHLKAQNFNAAKVLLASDHETQFFCAQDFIGCRFLPSKLCAVISKITGLLYKITDRYRDISCANEINKIKADFNFWQKISEDYFASNYVFTAKNEALDLCLSLLSLDAAEALTDLYDGKCGIVFFSATLLPQKYFCNLLYSKTPSESVEFLKLKSPFDNRRRLVAASTDLSIKYKDRDLTLAQVAKRILKVIALHRGHYLVFCPSFSYQRKLIAYLRTQPQQIDLEIIVQRQGLSVDQKQEFIRRFSKYSENRSLLGLVVMGSVFNEGLDLYGKQLTGVVVIGTGMPKVSPEREILRQYYDAKGMDGAKYAFVYPGINKVLQAAGRLIRTMDDYGVILLLDSRYQNYEYQKLLPFDLNLQLCDSEKELLSDIRTFWEELQDI